MNLKKLTQTIFIVLCALVLSSCKPEGNTKVLKLAHSLDTKHPVHKAIVYLAERVDVHSGGEMKVDIYPAGQLGSERELMELLQIGSLAMTKVSTSPMEGFVPEMKIFSLPYVFRDNDHFWDVLNSDIGKKLLLQGEAVRLRGLCYFDAGSRSFYTVKKPVHSPADLTAQKIRIQNSQTAFQMVQAFGGKATPVNWGELYTALQQGVVDGAENNPPSFYSSKHYEVAKYYTLNEHTMVPDMLLISSYIWERLSDQERQWLSAAIDEAVLFQRKLWKEFSEESLKIVQEAGVEIIYPDKGPFESKVIEMHSSVKGTPVYDLIQAIREI